MGYALARTGMGLVLALALMLAAAGGVFANEALLELQQDDAQWALTKKNYAGTRYSSLDQITTENLAI